MGQPLASNDSVCIDMGCCPCSSHAMSSCCNVSANVNFGLGVLTDIAMIATGALFGVPSSVLGVTGAVAIGTRVWSHVWLWVSRPRKELEELSLDLQDENLILQSSTTAIGQLVDRIVAVTAQQRQIQNDFQQHDQEVAKQLTDIISPLIKSQEEAKRQKVLLDEMYHMQQEIRASIDQILGNISKKSDEKKHRADPKLSLSDISRGIVADLQEIIRVMQEKTALFEGCGEGLTKQVNLLRTELQKREADLAGVQQIVELMPQVTEKYEAVKEENLRLKAENAALRADNAHLTKQLAVISEDSSVE